MYNTICMILEIVNTIFTGYCLAYYFNSFLKKKYFFRKSEMYLLVVLFVITDYLLDYFFETGFETKETINKLFVLGVVIFVFAKLFYHSNLQMLLFLTITFITIKDLCSFLSMMVIVYGNKLFDLWLFLLEKEYLSVEIIKQFVDGTAILLQTFGIIGYVVLFYISLKAVIKNFKNKEYPVSKEEWLFLLIPESMGFLLCILLRTILVTMEEGLPMDLYEKYPKLMIVVPFIVVLSLLSIVYSIKIFQNFIAFNKEKNDKLILEKQMKQMQEHILEMEHIYSGIRSMKHDMKNTLSIIMQLAVKEENQSNEELQNYLFALNKTMDRLDFQFKTGNSVVDILLNMKYHELTKTIPDILFYADNLVFPKNLQIQSYDIGIIIGNALDNAVEACKKLKSKEANEKAFIRLYSFVKGNMFFIEVKNSFDGKLLQKKYSEFPITDKSDKKIHGIGFYNIKNTAEKYHGGVDWIAENRTFTLIIMLQCV